MIGGYSPEAIEKPLHEYQQFAVDWILKRVFVNAHGGAGLFMDPGLGKTRCTLSILDVLFKVGNVRRALIVAPLRPAYGVWPDEIKRWGFPQSHVILHDQHVRAMAMDQQIEIINYDGLERVAHLANRWDAIVLDESTFVKTWDANRTEFIRAMVKHIPIRLILTGTPAANSLGDLFSQMFVVDLGEALGRNVTQFRMNKKLKTAKLNNPNLPEGGYMFQSGWRGRKWFFREEHRNQLLDAIKGKVLRMRAEDHLDMPDLVDHAIWCKMPRHAYKQYNRLRKDLYAELETGDVYAKSAASAYIKCRQFANGQVYRQDDPDGPRVVHNAHDRKIQALDELQEELAGKPLLVFYPFTSDLERIIGHRNSPFKKAPIIRGKMKNDDVARILEEWNGGDHRNILCQWQAASHGLNMQGCCNDVGAFGVPDSLEVFEQAYRRVYRQGVTGSQVRIHRFLTEDTVDVIQNERLHGKFKTQHEFLEALKHHAKVA